MPSAPELRGAADLVLKVKEPIAQEYSRMRTGQVLFTYLHLAASRECTDAILSSGVTAIAYETVCGPAGTLPLLAPMSEVAGKLGAPGLGAGLTADSGRLLSTEVADAHGIVAIGGKSRF